MNASENKNQQTEDTPIDNQSSAHAANDGQSGGATANLDLILEIPVTLSMEIGRTRMKISELLSLSSGSIVELQRMVDEPLDVLVNGTLVAHGEAVVIDGKFGIRLTDVMSKQERISNLQNEIAA
ncbi:flagellar motor switch protein FliN [Chromatiales bacterium (ex Bugula neritina AB1)]|nr:flagellar motor switch protein FliN [Chromatiales bacterium (ex Bugula neritina AB1)]